MLPGKALENEGPAPPSQPVSGNGPIQSTPHLPEVVVPGIVQPIELLLDAVKKLPLAPELDELVAALHSAAIENIRIHQELEKLLLQRVTELEAANEELRAETNLRREMEAKVLHLSLTDEMTGLNNRRGFLLRAEQMLKLVDRVQTRGWLIYIDLDGLKRINDRMGHDAGDRLIASAAKVLRESFRDSDILGRVGGDEFVVFAAGSSTPATEIEERLNHNIAHQNFCHPNEAPLSMSIGVIRCDPHSLHNLEEMIHQADAAMYIEKRRKRARLQDQLGNL